VIGLLVALGIVVVLVVFLWKWCPWMGVEDEMDHSKPQREIEG